MKVVINNDYGGFGLSEEAKKAMKRKGCPHLNEYDNNHRENRTCPILVEIVEKMGVKANDGCSQLKIVNLPDNVEFLIEAYDGFERVAEWFDHF